MKFSRIAVLLAVLLSVAAPARADLPRGSRDDLKGARTVYVDAVVGARDLIEMRIRRDLPNLTVVADERDADCVLRFSFSNSSASVAEERDVTVTRPNPNYRTLSEDERRAGKMQEPVTIQVTEKETHWVMRPVDRLSGHVLRRLPSAALLPVLDYSIDVPDGLGGRSAETFARWFAKEFKKANK